MTIAATPKAPSSQNGCPAPVVRITRSAERDFEELPCAQQRKVLEVLSRPFRREKIKRLRSWGGTKLWRITVPGIRIVVASRPREHIDYVWRIDDRKDIYGIVDNLDPRIDFAGISIEEFLMKYEHEMNGQQPIIPPGSSPTSSPMATPSAPPAPADGPAPTEEAVRGGSRHHPLLRELSTYIGLALCDEIGAAREIFREDLKRVEAEVKGHGEWIGVCDARQSVLSDSADQLAQDCGAMAGRLGGLSETVVGVIARVNAAGERLDAMAIHVDTIAIQFDTELSDHRRAVAGQLDAFATTLAEDRQQTARRLDAIGERLDLLAKGVAVVRHLGSELTSNRAAIGALDDRLTREIMTLIDTVAAEKDDLKKSIEPLALGLEAVRDDQARLRAEIARRGWTARLARVAASFRSFGNRRDR